MARYIDSEKAVEEARLIYCKDCNSYNGVICRSCPLDDALDFIEDYPTAENVAEVVFCHNCKYAHRVSDEFGNLEYFCRTMHDYMSPIDYCSRGERKEGAK